MLNLVSLLIGAVALVCAAVAFIPFLGWLNWFIIPIALVGTLVGALSRGNAGRNLNLAVIVIGLSGCRWVAGFFEPGLRRPLAADSSSSLRV